MKEEHIQPFRAALEHFAETDWRQQQGVLAQEAEISGGYLSELLSGKKVPSQKVANNIAKACKSSFDDFIDLGSRIVNQNNRAKEQIKSGMLLNEVAEELLSKLKAYDDPSNSMFEDGPDIRLTEAELASLNDELCNLVYKIKNKKSMKAVLDTLITIEKIDGNAVSHLQETLVLYFDKLLCNRIDYLNNIRDDLTEKHPQLIINKDS